MKKLVLITALLCLQLFVVEQSYCQKKSAAYEIGRWELMRNPKSVWEFTTDGKLLMRYMGRDSVFTYTYILSNSKSPDCPGKEVGKLKDMKYLKRINDQDGSIRCFYVTEFKKRRFTLVDALTARISKFTKVDWTLDQIKLEKY